MAVLRNQIPVPEKNVARFHFEKVIIVRVHASQRNQAKNHHGIRKANYFCMTFFHVNIQCCESVLLISSLKAARV